jgi:AcrR family transcriptional regulator
MVCSQSVIAHNNFIERAHCTAALLAELLNASTGCSGKWTNDIDESHLVFGAAMAQRQKPEVREAILESAFRQFSKRGYTSATIPQIAAGAKISTANFYVYFRSKLEVVFAIYEPWLRTQLDKLEEETDLIADPERRLRRILTVLWREIPAMNNGFSTNIMQALSAGTRDEGYESRAIRWAEGKIAGMIKRTLITAGAPAVDSALIAHTLFMAFDGFSLNYHLNPWAACTDELVDAVCQLLLRGATHRAARTRARA